MFMNNGLASVDAGPLGCGGIGRRGGGLRLSRSGARVENGERAGPGGGSSPPGRIDKLMGKRNDQKSNRRWKPARKKKRAKRVRGEAAEDTAPQPKIYHDPRTHEYEFDEN